MGHDIAKSLAKEYYIISKDKGYDPAIHEMRRLSGLAVKRLEDIAAAMEKKSGLASKLKGFFKSGKGSEESDKTEHVVVGKNNKLSLSQTKKDVKIEPKAEKAPEKKVDKEPVKKVDKVNTEKPKKEEKPVQKTDKANIEKPKKETKPAQKTEKANIEKPKKEIKQEQKPKESAPVSAVSKSNEPASETGEASKSGNRNRHRRKKKHPQGTDETVNNKNDNVSESSKKQETTIVEKSETDIKNEASGSEKVTENKVPDNKNVSQEVAGDSVNSATVKKHRNNRNRRRHHNNGNNNQSMAEEKTGDNKAPVAPPKTKEEEERERARQEAFALLSELDEQEKNEAKPVYIRKK